MTKSSARDDDELYERVAQILEQARGQVARSVNTAMVQAYWLIGREIVEVEQAGEQRAGYGQNVLARLAARLKASFGKGFSVQNLGYMRQFYLAFLQGLVLPEIPQALPGELRDGTIRQASPGGSGAKTGRVRNARVVGCKARQAPSGEPSMAQMFPPALGWTQYVLLMRIANPTARAFYEIEAAREAWSTRQLERQIGSLLFERLTSHRAPEKILALARRGQEVAKPWM
jgi:predicted nuclease of restriction endonuclease-like (RecB) superfamily